MARWTLRAIGLGAVGLLSGLAALPAAAQQVVPEVVKPRTDSPTLPPGPGDSGTPRPRSENPLAEGGGTKPVPDSGVVAPTPGVGSPMVIQPPATGTMPVIPPPGTPGGDRSVVPK